LVSLRDDESFDADAWRALGAALSAAGTTMGLVTMPYPFIEKYSPQTAASFYGNWVSNPVFLCIAALGYVVVGASGLVRTFRKKA
jgi:hypothetical protein